MSSGAKVLEHPSARDLAEEHLGEPLVGPEVVAEWLGVSKRWVQDKANRGEIPHKKIGKLLRFAPAEVRSWALDDCDRTGPGSV